MDLVVVGCNGMLGQDVVRVARERQHFVTCVDRPAINITDLSSCRDAIGRTNAIVNCAAYTNVDACESNEPEAFAVNALGVANLAHVAREIGARLVHVSTDYVFPGDSPDPLPEDTAPWPVSAYGRTKVAGEWAALAHGTDNLVVRTAWLYGQGGNCFPKTIAAILRERGTAEIVADQHGQPTWSLDLAGFLLDLVEHSVPGGVYHGTSAGQTTWHEFGVEIARAIGLPADAVTPTDSSTLDRPAKRPEYSILGHDACEAAGVEPIGDWRERWRLAAPIVLS